MAGIERGTRVSWNTPQGRTRGRVVETHAGDVELHGQAFRGSPDDPVYIVESDKTGARAAHKRSALHPLG